MMDVQSPLATAKLTLLRITDELHEAIQNRDKQAIEDKVRAWRAADEAVRRAS